MTPIERGRVSHGSKKLYIYNLIGSSQNNEFCEIGLSGPYNIGKTVKTSTFSSFSVFRKITFHTLLSPFRVYQILCDIMRFLEMVLKIPYYTVRRSGGHNNGICNCCLFYIFTFSINGTFST